MDVAQRFGENLRRFRKEASISQEELGLRSELHRTEIGLLERGARVPRIDTLIKIASGLGICPDALFIGISWTPATTQTQGGGFQIKPRIEQDVREARDELERRTERREDKRLEPPTREF